MAEKYGVVPKKFSAAWWGYFWYYYKWRVLGIAFAVLCVVFTVVQCASKKKYDIHVTYAGHKIYTQEKTELLADIISQYITDADGNGENSVLVQQINFADLNGHEEYDYAAQTKLDVEMQEDCSFIFLLDKEMLSNMLNREYANELYVPVSQWASENIDENLLYSKDNEAYAVSLENSSLLKGNDIYSDDLYILIRRNYKQNDKNTIAYEGSISAAKELIKQ